MPGYREALVPSYSSSVFNSFLELYKNIQFTEPLTPSADTTLYKHQT